MPDQTLSPLNVRHLRAALPPASYNPKDRTVEVVWTTGRPIQRSDWLGESLYLEVLSLEPGAVDLTRLNNGAPVLNAHSATDLRDQIGVVMRADIEAGQGRAILRLSDRPEIAGIVADILARIIRNVSIGYHVDAWHVAPATDLAPETHTATRWTPYEVSFVPIPADQKAQVRSFSTDHEDLQMDPVNQAPDPVAAERERAATIYRLATRARVERDFAEELVRRGVPLDQARDHLIDEVARRNAHTISTVNTAGLDDGRGGRRRRMMEALAARMAGREPPPAARAFVGMTLLDMIRADLDALGVNTRGMRNNELMRRGFAGMNTTSDYPNLLQGAGQRFLAERYQAAQSPLRSALARVRSVNDFRDISILRIGEAPQLEKVAEGGPVLSGSTQESAEVYRVDTYAKIFSLSRQAIINDDLQAFADFGNMVAVAAAEAEARLLVNLLTTNSGAGGNLADGNPLFTSGRGNLLTGSTSALTADSAGIGALGKARAAMRKFTALDGVTPVAAEPAFLLVPPDIETAADQVTAQLSPQAVADANSFGGTIRKLVEPRLTGTSWYLFAAPTQAPVFEVAYLNGAAGPQLTTREGFDTLGVEFRAMLDFGAGVVGWRGAVRSAGA